MEKLEVLIDINLISILLFLDFRTGRVERFIINSSDPTLNLKVNKKSLGLDYKEDLYFTWNNEKFKVLHDSDHGPWINGETVLSQLGDGKLNRKYYAFFIAELMRDYFKYFNSFNNGNIASLRKLTLPIEPAKIDKDGEIIKSAIGTGKTYKEENLVNLLHDSIEYRKRDFFAFKAHKFITNTNDEPTSEDKWTIFIPQFLKNEMVNNWLNNLNYNVIYANKSELSQLVKDFNRTLSIKTISNVDDIVIRIRQFNYNIVRQLKMKESSSYNSKTLKVNRRKDEDL
jgi:hypothetical protein